VKKPKGLIFDLDDTLFDSNRAYEAALATLGLSLRNPRYLKSRDAVKRLLPPRHASARNRLLYFKTLLTAEKKYSPAAVIKMMDRYEKALASNLARQWKALNRNKLFAWLSARFSIVLLSNENLRTQLLKLKAVDPRARFLKQLITSEEIGAEKPDRRMFDAAQRRLGVAYQDCLMIGDNLQDDVIPALELGMRAVLTREFIGGALSLQVPATVISKLDHLQEILA
jgi:putative hydrolase of the HAD superfamily